MSLSKRRNRPISVHRHRASLSAQNPESAPVPLDSALENNGSLATGELVARRELPVLRGTSATPLLPAIIPYQSARRGVCCQLELRHAPTRDDQVERANVLDLLR